MCAAAISSDPSGSSWAHNVPMMTCGWRGSICAKRRSYPGWSCCPEPGSESRRSLGQRLGGGSGLVGRDPPGSLTTRVVHSLSGSRALGFQPWKGRRPEEKYFMYTRGIIEKKFVFFPKRLLGYWSDVFSGPCSNYFVSVRVYFRQSHSSNNTKK